MDVAPCMVNYRGGLMIDFCLGVYLKGMKSKQEGDAKLKQIGAAIQQREI